MGQQDCIFTKIIAGEIPCEKIYEDDAVFAFLDINPVSDGHTLVIPKTKYEKLDECPEDVLADFCARLGKIAKAVGIAMNADGYNVLCNNGKAAGQLVDYVHFHIIPRKEGDGVVKHWPSYQYPDGKMQEIGENIRKRF